MNINEDKAIGSEVISLPRGGFLVQTPAGNVQFGSPPETIKDTMKLPGGVPEIFVLPEKMFNWVKGISIGEIEFPLYWNFFIRKKKTLIICREEQFKKMKRVLEESVFGPEKFSIADDYAAGADKEIIPDIRSEMSFFRGGNKLSNMVQFGIFRNNRFSHGGISITIDESGDYDLYYNKKHTAKVPGNIEYKTTYLIGERLPEPYLPPLFGVTCLGPSHGFDPEENTSGFIIWLNHQGIMVDPPVNSTEWLEDSNVSPKFIDSIILTHCHADHDAGTFQKILEEGKVTVYTTETVMMSFLRKYSALSDVSVEYLLGLFHFQPVKIGDPLYINGGKFEMFYTLHSIPTIGFKMDFQNQTFVYSSDHNNNPELHDQLLNEGVISSTRYEELRNFPWDSRVIYHESGVPPLHTPIGFMNSLPDDIQKRIVIYHIAKSDFPGETSLTLAKFGMENTLYFETEAPKFEDAYQVLSVFKRLDFMNDMPVYKAQELLDIVETRKFNKGDLIIKEGTKGDEFFIIYSGNISVKSEGLEKDKIYGPYDYFGEVALITDQTRAADIYAETDVVLFAIGKDRFLNFISGTEFEKILRRVAATRSPETWNLLSMNDFFRQFTPAQKTWIESIFFPEEISSSTDIIRENEPLKKLYLVRDGIIEVYRNDKKITNLVRGDFVGSLERLCNDKPAYYTFRNPGPVSLYSMKSVDLKYFIEKNPGLLMKFTCSISDRIR